jgi:hypothetical protein
MSKKRTSRNAPCPCGSGKKYKHCCNDKGFEWIEDEDGVVGKSIPLTEEIKEVFEQVRQAFTDKHGREPGSDELLFTDLPHLEHLEAMLVGDMKSAGLDPAFIFAFEKTGLLVSEENQRLIPEKNLEEWRSAVEEYRRNHSKTQNPMKYPMGTMAFYGPDDKTTTKIAAGVFTAEVLRKLGAQERRCTVTADEINRLFPNIADWIQGSGWIEIGNQEWQGFVVRAPGRSCELRGSLGETDQDR